MNLGKKMAGAYERLNGEERAILIFNYLAEKNQLEAMRLHASAPQYSYRGPDIEYRSKLQGLVNMASLWTIEYWQVRARKAESIGQLQTARERNDARLMEFALLGCRCWDAVLRAIDQALQLACEQIGIDRLAVYQWSGAEAYEPEYPDHPVNEIYQAKFVEQLLAAAGVEIGSD